MAMLNTADILETINMIREENLDIRTVTMGISLLDCGSADTDSLCNRIYDKITRRAQNLVSVCEKIEKEYGIPMILHQNETPVAAMACMQVAVASENFMAMEFHHHDCTWWNDLVICKNNPIVDNGFVNISYEPGLGVEAWNDEVLREHLHISNDQEKIWMDTDEWNDWYASDRIWL